MAAAPITSAGASRLGGLGHRQSFLVAVGIVLVVAVGVVLALCLGGTATACAFFCFAFDFGRFNFLAIRSSMQKKAHDCMIGASGQFD